MRRKFGWMACGVALVSLSAHAQDGVTLNAADKEGLGQYLTDDEGMSLYLFEADSKMTSTCYDACAVAWPPLVMEGEPQAGEAVEPSLISTFERGDGTTQVAYDGWPLYYFAKDRSPGETSGQDIEGFGAEWYLVSPEGGKVEAHEEQG